MDEETEIQASESGAATSKSAGLSVAGEGSALTSSPPHDEEPSLVIEGETPMDISLIRVPPSATDVNEGKQFFRYLNPGGNFYTGIDIKSEVGGAKSVATPPITSFLGSCSEESY